MPVISIGTWTEGSPASAAFVASTAGTMRTFPLAHVYGAGTTSNATLIVSNWMSLGGRGVDTAYVYFDQAKVAAAIVSSGVKRSEVFITVPSRPAPPRPSPLATRAKALCHMEVLGVGAGNTPLTLLIDAPWNVK